MKTLLQKSLSPILLRAFFAFSTLLTFSFLTQNVQAQWNPNTMVNMLISSLPTADMQAASTTDGKTWIAFYHENAGNYDMRAQLIDADGYKLLGNDGILVSNQTSGSATYVFNVCVDLDNNLIIGMQDMRTLTMKAVVYKISQAGAQLWGANGIVLGGGLVPYCAALSNGETAVVWSGDTGNTLNLQKITTTGTLAWASAIPITVGGSATTRGQLITNTGGKFTLVCQKGSMSTTLYAQMFSSSGTALYAPLQLCDQTTAPWRYYSIASEADTTFYGYYSSSGMRFNSFLQRINPNGTIPWGMNGSNFNTSTGTNDNYQGETRINLTPGSNYVWSVCTFSNPNQTQYGVYIQKFLKSSGARQLSDAGKVVYPISSSGDTQAGELALVDDQPMFMSYITNYKIYATRLNGYGNFVWPGNKVEISSTTATAGNGKMRYCFTPDGPNRCAGTWTENRGGAGYMGYAQGISVGGLVGVTVDTQGGIPPLISTNGGTLQLVATVYPSTASQNVTWSIAPGTGMATISGTGLVTAVSNGTAYAKATAVQDTTVSGTLMITMSNQAAQPPSVITLGATNVTANGATLNGSVNANSLSTAVSFDWGLTSAYGNLITSIPPTVTGSTATPVQAVLSGLTSNTTYHFRVKGNNAAGLATGLDSTFTTPAGVGIVENNAGIISISPVPNNGRFSVTINSEKQTSYTLDIYNALGLKVYADRDIPVNGSKTTTVDLGRVPAGLYTVILSSENSQVIRKVLVN